MTNAEFADVLERMAAHYRVDDRLPEVSLSLFLSDKDTLRSTLKSLGGKWVKAGMNDNSEYADLRFTSPTFGPLTIYIPRSKVCRKIVTFECDPIMSPEDEAELFAEVGA